jgi:Ala-tRNA(Pro) deacylase
MAMANMLRAYLDKHGIHYDLLPHPRTADSMRTAEVAHVPGDQVAKSVVLRDERGYLMVVLPATRRVALGQLHKTLDRYLGLATEQELGVLFTDCEAGAVPAVGDAYGIATMVDESLEGCPDVYIESGDHEQLLHLTGAEFAWLTHELPHGRFSRHV